MTESIKCESRWIAGNRDRISLTLSKGKKNEIKIRAKSHGMSLNAYINELIKKDVGPLGR